MLVVVGRGGPLTESCKPARLGGLSPWQTCDLRYPCSVGSHNSCYVNPSYEGDGFRRLSNAYRYPQR